jgi:ABC-2 type transport system ATP-binding protein
MSGDAGGVLVCTGLRKAFGELVAVDDVSFSIAEGETYGLLGPNGAGKTTTISMVAGILERDHGDVTLDGDPVTTRGVRAKARIGYVPQELAVYPDLSARENLRFFARLYGMSRAESRERVAEVLETVGLTDRAGDLVKDYSGGMKRRINIAIGLLHRPRLLILDEPTAGVDPQSRNAILAGVERLAAQGIAVLYTTHYMEEAERLCDRVGIIDSGRLIAEGTRRELVGRVGEHDRITLLTDGPPEAVAAAVRRVARLPAVRQAGAEDGTGNSATDGSADGVEDASLDGSADRAPGGARDGRVELLVEDARASLAGILDAAQDAGAAVRSVEVAEPDLETVFLHLTGKALRE